jgi:hypothetical protein
LAAASRFGKTKTPPPFGGGVLEILCQQSEPDRRAAKQRVKHQVQIQIAIHSVKIAGAPARVKLFLASASVVSC